MGVSIGEPYTPRAPGKRVQPILKFMLLLLVCACLEPAQGLTLQADPRCIAREGNRINQLLVLIFTGEGNAEFRNNHIQLE